MLPFLKPKAVAGVIMSKRKPDGAGIESGPMEGDGDQGLEACATDLIRAIHSKDAKAVAEALQAAFDCIGSAPPGDDENDFDSQNAKAALSQQE